MGRPRPWKPLHATCRASSCLLLYQRPYLASVDPCRISIILAGSVPRGEKGDHNPHPPPLYAKQSCRGDSDRIRYGERRVSLHTEVLRYTVLRSAYHTMRPSLHQKDISGRLAGSTVPQTSTIHTSMPAEASTLRVCVHVWPEILTYSTQGLGFQAYLPVQVYMHMI